MQRQSSVRALRAAVLCAVLGIVTAGWSVSAAQDGQATPPGASQDQQETSPRRRTARIVLPWSQLEDLTPRQEMAIREIRTEILNRRDELDREERQRILELLTEPQRQRVAEIEAERQRQQAQRRRQREQERSGQGQ